MPVGLEVLGHALLREREELVRDGGLGGKLVVLGNEGQEVRELRSDVSRQDFGSIGWIEPFDRRTQSTRLGLRDRAGKWRGDEFLV